MKLIQGDCLEVLKTIEDNSIDLIFTDPPYALGSEITIRLDGKPDYKKAVDFMNKWDMPTAGFWEQWYKEAIRVLKYGGHCLMFGMDRQLLLFKYYAHLAGFIEKQSLYWFFICLSDDSEILTDNGWRRIDTIKETDKVAEYDLQANKVLFKEPKDIYRFDFDGELIYIANENTEQLLTPNHRCVILEEGELKFKYAYELIGKQTQFATIDRQEVWKLQVLEKLQTMWRGFCCWNSATKETVLQYGLPEDLSIGNQEGKTATKQGRAGKSKMCRLWKRVFEMAKRYKSGARKYLFPSMHSQIAKTNGNKKRDWQKEQGQEAITSRKGNAESQSGSWSKTSLLEGRNNLQTTKGKLLWRKICSLSAGILDYGSERRICYGTSFSGSQSVQDFRENGNSSSYQSQAMGQPFRELNAIQEQSRPQEARSRTRYKTSLAIPTLKEYKGRVWCVETSTGAFIARRNGKSFITGNSNFPKASDLSKMIDKNAGAGREVVGHLKAGKTAMGQNSGWNAHNNTTTPEITIASTPLAKKYSGYKYSISPLKQTNETIMVFQKPYKTGSCLYDTLAYENGDKEITVGALDIDGNRVDFQNGADRKESTEKNQHEKFGTEPMTGNNAYGDFSMVQPKNYQPSGRYPSQTIVSPEAAEVLDRQSGVKAGNGHNSKTRVSGFGEFGGGKAEYFGVGEKLKDFGGCSKILHKCEYEETDLYFYCPKVSKSERGQDNRHPTVKPIKLTEKLLRLFKTPDTQIILDPFMGSGTTGIACKNLGIDFIGIEVNEDYFKIATARIKNTPDKLI